MIEAAIYSNTSAIDLMNLTVPRFMDLYAAIAVVKQRMDERRRS